MQVQVIVHNVLMLWFSFVILFFRNVFDLHRQVFYSFSSDILIQQVLDSFFLMFAKCLYLQVLFLH